MVEATQVVESTTIQLDFRENSPGYKGLWARLKRINELPVVEFIKYWGPDTEWPTPTDKIRAQLSHHILEWNLPDETLSTPSILPIPSVDIESLDKLRYRWHEYIATSLLLDFNKSTEALDLVLGSDNSLIQRLVDMEVARRMEGDDAPSLSDS